MNQRIKKAALVKLIREQFRCDWRGIHGPVHWGRVRLNGLHLAGVHGGSPHVIELFALLHDSKRENEGHDPGHGPRASVWARELRGHFFEATDLELELLCQACDGHSDGLLKADVTVQCCWDADRLDLWRVGVRPRAEYLCTVEAQRISDGIVQWPSRRSDLSGWGRNS